MSNKKINCKIHLPKELRSEITQAILVEGKIKIIGLGIFETKHINSRTGKHPSTGKIIDFKSHKKLRFKPTASLKRIINNS